MSLPICDNGLQLGAIRQASYLCQQRALKWNMADILHVHAIFELNLFVVESTVLNMNKSNLILILQGCKMRKGADHPRLHLEGSITSSCHQREDV